VRLRITPDIEKNILARIRAGSHPRAAAESAGVPRHILRQWLTRGRKQANGRFRQFWLHLYQAQGQALAKAGIDVREQDVKFWLRYGPGQERRSARKPTAQQREGAVAVTEVMQLLSRLTQRLEPFPDARQAILTLLDAETLP
jgi:hypothetical protein